MPVLSSCTYMCEQVWQYSINSSYDEEQTVHLPIIALCLGRDGGSSGACNMTQGRNADTSSARWKYDFI